MAKTPSLRNAGAFGKNDLPTLPVKKATARGPVESSEGTGSVSIASEGAVNDAEALNREGGRQPLGTNGIEKVPENVWLDVRQMSVWIGNPRHVIDAQALDELIEDIRNNGQQHAVDVIPDEENPGRYLIIGGQRRWKAISAGELNNGRILARVRTDLTSIEDIYAVAFATQMLTAPLKDIDYAISVALKSNEIGIRKMARALEKNAGELSKLSKIGSLPSELISIFKEYPDKFTTTIAYNVAIVQEKQGTAVAVDFAREIKEKDLTVKKTALRKEELLSSQGEKTRAKRKSWDTQHFKTYGGILKTNEGTGELTLQLSSLKPEQLEKIRGTVLEILSSEH